MVILNFWGTWCGPCIQALPHLEALQKQFSNDVQVLTITDESEERINRFLTKRELSLPVVLDHDRKLAAAFPYRMVSHTVVIDKDGVVRAVTTPEKVTEEILKKVIAGQPVDLPEKIDVIDFDPSKPLSGNENFTYQVTVTPYQNGFPSMSNPFGVGVYRGRRILCINLAPQSLYEVAYRFPVSTRTVIEVEDKTAFSWTPQTAICFDLIVPDEMGENRFEIMKQHLGNLFPYRATIEKRLRDCRVLKPIAGQAIKLTPAAGGSEETSYSGRGFSMKNGSMKSVCEFLESMFNVPVIDETSLTGMYDVQLSWYNEDPNQIHEELRKLGLALTEERRAIEVLVIYDK